jgi:hypothetical protein
MPLMWLHTTHMAIPVLAALSVAIGMLINLIAWNFVFPTSIERTLEGRNSALH